MTWLSSRVAQLTATHLPVGARVLVIAPKPARPLIVALKKRGLDATGMVAMPQLNRHEVVNWAREASADMLILIMGLSNIRETDRYAVAELARVVAPLALFVDWQRAERNLEVPADVIRRLFFFMTRSHAARCPLTSYDAIGGLNGVLHAWGRQGRVVARQSCLAGCVGLALVAWEPLA